MVPVPSLPAAVEGSPAASKKKGELAVHKDFANTPSHVNERNHERHKTLRLDHSIPLHTYDDFIQTQLYVGSIPIPPEPLTEPMVNNLCQHLELNQ